MTRYAVVRNAGTRHKAEVYLPTNYRVIHETTRLRGDDGEKTPVFVIAGEDSHGWTLDDYVIPRYASGLIWAEEIDSDNPILEGVTTT